MRLLIKIFLIALPVFFLNGCESEEVYYNLPVANKKLIVYCFFNPDSIWSVNVSKLGDILDEEKSDLWVTNASVFLYEDNLLIDTLVYLKAGVYISTKGLKPLYNKDYNILVKCSGYGDVFSTNEKLPAPVTISDVVYYNFLLENVFPNDIYIIQQTEQFVYASLEFKVNNSLKNQFFKVFLSNDTLGNREGVSLSKDAKKDFTEYYSWECSVLESNHGGELFMQMPVIPEQQRYLSVYTVSESYILYELSYAEYDFVINSTYLLTPNNIYSNISGGCGVFAGYTSNRIDLKDYYK